jgi:hypothetical protein
MYAVALLRQNRCTLTSDRWSKLARSRASLRNDSSPSAKVLGKARRAQRHGGALAAAGERGRHVLLDGDLAQQHVIAREVDDAEAAGAQHADDLEFAESSARAQGVVHRHPSGAEATSGPEWSSARKHRF